MPGTSWRADASERRLDRAEEITSHTFRDRELLRRALTHPSASEGRDPSCYYERLEFLGDSVVGFLIAEEVYRRFPELPEGGMTRVKVSVVAGSTLADVASRIGLEECIILGDSERGTRGRGLESALENAFEALTAALYLDGGIRVARRWVLRTLGPRISSEPASTHENPKSHLQELLQARGVAPEYRIVEVVGPPHDRVFTAVVGAGDTELGRGNGRSKKEAEAEAAAHALERLHEH